MKLPWFFKENHIIKHSMLNFKKKNFVLFCFLSLLAFESLDSFPTVKFLYHWWTFLIPAIIILKCLLRYACIGWIQRQRFYGEDETQDWLEDNWDKQRGWGSLDSFSKENTHADWPQSRAEQSLLWWLSGFLWTTSLWNLAQAELEASQSSISNSITKLQ